MSNINGYNSQTGEWYDTLTGDYLWSSVDTRQASPDVMTPYTWSAIRNAFAQMTMLPGYLPVGNICGRLYNHASAGATAFKALGQGNSFYETSNELYGVDPDNISDWNVPLLPIGLRDRMLVLYNALRIMANVRKALKSMETFLDTNMVWCETQHRNLSNMGKDELICWSEEVFLPYMVTCFWSISSPAIVARELGIPAVVGCFNATTVLKTGDRVRVDGGAGSVEVIERIG